MTQQDTDLATVEQAFGNDVVAMYERYLGAQQPADDVDLEDRLTTAYKQYTQGRSTRGAQAWLARVARMHPTSVHRILNGTIPADRAESTLDLVEDLVMLRAALEHIQALNDFLPPGPYAEAAASIAMSSIASVVLSHLETRGGHEDADGL